MNTLHLRRTIFICAVAALAVTALPLGAAPATDGPVADVHLGTTQVQWAPKADFAGLRLTVAGPNGTEQFDFGAGESPLLDLASVVADIDGQYSWELRAIPQVNVQQISAAARTPGFEAGDRQRPAGLPAAADLVQSGTFTVSGGAIVQPMDEPRTELQVQGAGGSNKVTGDLGYITAELVHAEDVSIIGSLCVGFDCVSSESFGFDTIRMKENNTRLAFTDTSNSGSFPSNDWTIVANDSFNGGASYLAFQDDETGRLPFRVEAAARANALVVEADGHIGIGALNPAVNIHVVEGNTPALRLEQDGSSGFTPHIWDVAGNEANFFVRNVTNASALAFRIKPGSGTSNALVIAGDGDIGMGTENPSASLHIVEGSGGSVTLRVQDTAGDAILDIMELQNNGEVRFAMEDTSTASRRWEFRTTGPNFQFTRDDAPSADMLIDSSGNMTIRGTLTTNGPTCDTGCDEVLSPGFAVESIAEHAELMFSNSYLPAVGPTQPKQPINLSEKTGGILNELEKAHIYIVQLDERNKHLKAQQDELVKEITELKKALSQLLGQ